MLQDLIYTVAGVIVLAVGGLVGAYLGGGIGLVVSVAIFVFGIFGISRLAARIKKSGQTGP